MSLEYQRPAAGMPCYDMKSIEIFTDTSCQTYMDPEG